MSPPPEPRDPPAGRLLVNTASGAAFVVIRDWNLRTVKAQRTPVDIHVPPGLYSITLTRARSGTQKYVGKVDSGMALTLVFRESTVEERRSGNVFARTAAGLSDNLASLFGGTLNLAAVAPKFPPLQAPTVSPAAIDVRVMTLKDWDTAAPLRTVSTEMSLDNGVPCLIVHCTKDSPIVVQFAEPGKPVTNVIVPSRLMNAKDVRIYLHRPLERWRPRVEIRSQWENLAAEFISGGNLRAAREVASGQLGEQAPGRFEFLSDFTMRFRDVAAISYLPYLALRLASDDRLEAMPYGVRRIPEQLLRIFHALPDAHIVAAEFAARIGEHARALHHLLKLGPGHLPVYTDGFSILISRLRTYAGDGEFRTEGINDDGAAAALTLLETMLRWAPHVDFSSLTLSFTGADPAHPSSDAEPSHERTELAEPARERTRWTTMAVDSQAVDFSEVQKQEREQIKARREALDLAFDKDEEQDGTPRFPTLGLALSGGGIRSATFNLGIIQGLTRLGLLKHVDYLSTVSGGGYIGTWLHGVIQRYGQGDPRKVEYLLKRPDFEPHQESDKDPNPA